jgi:hypothetical protein
VYKPIIDSRGCALAAGLFVAASGSTLAAPVVINFDDVAADDIIDNALGVYPGDQYAGSGVLFRTGIMTGEVAVGHIVTLTDPVDEFEVLGGPGQPSISDPNFAIPRGAGNARDLLMIFTTPVTSIQVTTDDYSRELPDVVRLLALGATASPDAYTVLAFDEKLDDAITPPDNLLSVSLGGTPFSFALFEVTTEQEGFDDLTFVQTIAADLDIKPRSCPNPFNVGSMGVLPVAVLGTASLNVHTIDAGSVRLEGVAPLRSSIEDVAAPPIGREECACTTAGPDGLADMTLNFDSPSIAATLGTVANGEERALTLTGQLVDGTRFEARDCVRVNAAPNFRPTRTVVVPPADRARLSAP